MQLSPLVTFPLIFYAGHRQRVDNAEEQLDRRLPSSPGLGPNQVFPGVGHEPGGWQQHSAAPLHPPVLLRQGNPAPHLARWQQVPALRQSGRSLTQSARAGAHWNVWWVFVEAFLHFLFWFCRESFCGFMFVCVCVCARMHNCHLKGCFISASFHPHCNCKLEDRLWVRSLSSLFSIPAWLPNLSKRPVSFWRQHNWVWWSVTKFTPNS